MKTLIQALLGDPSPIKVSAPPFDDLRMILYVFVASGMGMLVSLASLLGQTNPLNWRVVTAYLLSGGTVAAGVVFFAVERFGPSWAVLGLALFAGYKAFDLLALGGIAVGEFIKWIIGIFQKKP